MYEFFDWLDGLDFIYLDLFLVGLGVYAFVYLIIKKIIELIERRIR